MISPASIFFEEVDAAEQGRLSATAAPNQREDFARANGEVDAAQYLHPTKGFSDAAYLDHSRSPAKPLAASRLSIHLPARSIAKHMTK